MDGGNDPERGEERGGANGFWPWLDMDPVLECERACPNVDLKGEDGCPFAPFGVRGDNAP
jgi:hypothetical protein